ncbi:Hypothetical predicted protein [Olea europaea subsp. europaea]|uniref:Uncharacterized protein n=1 Tax=Olea europaea subsp. europaea TaxID=158383 RepID=A0A8S0SJD9_OLEEU|nr:Hypothetical predicted protein [Olea europaea subsp. europaea]
MASGEGFLTMGQREILRIAMENAEVISLLSLASSPKATVEEAFFGGGYGLSMVVYSKKIENGMEKNLLELEWDSKDEDNKPMVSVAGDNGAGG